jgi:hypothetical protein
MGGEFVCDEGNVTVIGPKRKGLGKGLSSVEKQSTVVFYLVLVIPQDLAVTEQCEADP